MANDADILYLIDALAAAERYRRELQNARAVLRETRELPAEVYVRDISANYRIRREEVERKSIEQGGFDLSGLDLAAVPHPRQEGVTVDLNPIFTTFNADFQIPYTNLTGSTINLKPTADSSVLINHSLIVYQGMDLTDAVIKLKVPNFLLTPPRVAHYQLTLEILTRTSSQFSPYERMGEEEKAAWQKIEVGSDGTVTPPPPRPVEADRLSVVPTQPDVARIIILRYRLPVALHLGTHDLDEYSIAGNSLDNLHGIRCARALQGCSSHTRPMAYHPATQDIDVMPGGVLDMRGGIVDGCRLRLGKDTELNADYATLQRTVVYLSGSARLSLRGANVIGMRMNEYNGSGTQNSIRDSDWTVADCAMARFYRLSFDNVDVSNVDFNGAFFIDCNLMGALNLEARQLLNANVDRNTLLPERVARELEELRALPREEWPLLVHEENALIEAYMRNPDEPSKYLLRDYERDPLFLRTLYDQLTAEMPDDAEHERHPLADNSYFIAWVKFLRDYPVRFLKEETTEAEDQRIAELPFRAAVLVDLYARMVGGHVMNELDKRARDEGGPSPWEIE